MEKLILNDSTEIDIQDGASLGIITTILADYSAFLSLVSKLTKENLSHTTFQSGGITSAEYYSMALTEPNFYLTVRETGIEVTFGLRERTQEEIQEEAVAQAISYLSDVQALTVKNCIQTGNLTRWDMSTAWTTFLTCEGTSMAAFGN